jgi:hypothetical protein
MARRKVPATMRNRKLDIINSVAFTITLFFSEVATQILILFSHYLFYFSRRKKGHLAAALVILFLRVARCNGLKPVSVGPFLVLPEHKGEEQPYKTENCEEPHSELVTVRILG